MGKSSKRTYNESTKSTQVSPEYQAMLDKIMGQAQSAFDGTFTAYDKDRFAGFSDAEKYSQDNLYDYISGMSNSFDNTGKAFSFGLDRLSRDPTQQDLDPYMNMYRDTVTDYAAQDLVRDTKNSQANLRAQIAQSGAFGGSRGAVLQSEMDRSLTDALGKLRAEGRSTSFDNAMRNYYSGASAAMGAGAQGVSSQLAGLEALRASGANIRALEQQGKDFDYAEFMRELETPKQDAMNLSSIGYSYPTHLFDTKTTSLTKEQNSADPLKTLMGVAAMAAAPFTGGASLMGGAGGLAGAGSISAGAAGLMGAGANLMGNQGTAANFLTGGAYGGIYGGGGYKDGGLVTTRRSTEKDKEPDVNAFMSSYLRGAEPTFNAREWSILFDPDFMERHRGSEKLNETMAPESQQTAKGLGALLTAQPDASKRKENLNKLPLNWVEADSPLGKLLAGQGYDFSSETDYSGMLGAPKGWYPEPGEESKEAFQKLLAGMPLDPQSQQANIQKAISARRSTPKTTAKTQRPRVQNTKAPSIDVLLASTGVTNAGPSRQEQLDQIFNIRPKSVTKSIEEKRQHWLDNYMDNSLTKLGISLLAADTVGEGFKDYNELRSEEEQQEYLRLQEAAAIQRAEAQRQQDLAIQRYGLEESARRADQTHNLNVVKLKEAAANQRAGREAAYNLQVLRGKQAQDLAKITDELDDDGSLNKPITKPQLDALKLRYGVSEDPLTGKFTAENPDNLVPFYAALDRHLNGGRVPIDVFAEEYSKNFDFSE